MVIPCQPVMPVMPDAVTDGLSAQEQGWFNEMVKGGLLKQEDLDTFKAMSPAERKQYYDDFKKETAAPALTAQEQGWFDEMVKGGLLKQTDLDTFKGMSGPERKKYYDEFKKGK